MKFNNPFLLNRSFLNKNVEIVLRDLSKINGKLLAFDEHFNIFLKKNVKDSQKSFYLNNSIIVRGENVLFIAEGN